MSTTAHPIRLAVDYGTSHTAAVWEAAPGHSRPLLFDGTPLLPSAVFANPDGQLAAGADAARGVRLDPASYEPHPKRRIDDLEVLLGTRTYPIVDLVAATLRRVADEIARVAGPVHELTMTCPVAWGPARRAVLAEAATTVGLPAPTIVAEPIAAATYFVDVLNHELAPGHCLVVYDLGGGTLDVCVVRRTGSGFEPLAYRGLDDFGGVDLDALVIECIGRTVAADAPEAWRRLTQPTELSDRRHMRTLWDDARQAKEALSRQSQAGVYVPVVDRDVHVTREEFEQAARTALERTVEVTSATLREARVPSSDVTGICLVGGATRTPLVATLLHQGTGIAPTVLEQPETVVVEGALRAGRPAPAPADAPVAAGGADPAPVVAGTEPTPAAASAATAPVVAADESPAPALAVGRTRTSPGTPPPVPPASDANPTTPSLAPTTFNVDLGSPATSGPGFVVPAPLDAGRPNRLVNRLLGPALGGLLGIFGLTVAVASLISQSLHMSGDASYLSSYVLYAVAAMVAAPLIGWLGRHAPKMATLICIGDLIIGSAIAGLANVPAMFTVGRILGGLGTGGLIGLIWVITRRARSAMRLRLILAATAVVMGLLGQAVGNKLGELGSWRIPLHLVTVLALISLLVAATTMRGRDALTDKATPDVTVQ